MFILLFDLQLYPFLESYFWHFKFRLYLHFHSHIHLELPSFFTTWISLFCPFYYNHLSLFLTEAPLHLDMYVCVCMCEFCYILYSLHPIFFIILTIVFSPPFPCDGGAEWRQAGYSQNQKSSQCLMWRRTTDSLWCCPWSSLSWWRLCSLFRGEEIHPLFLSLDFCFYVCYFFLSFYFCFTSFCYSPLLFFNSLFLFHPLFFLHLSPSLLSPLTSSIPPLISPLIAFIRLSSLSVRFRCL